MLFVVLPALAAEPPRVAVLAPAPAEAPDPVSVRVSIVPGLGLGAAPDAAVDGIATGSVSRASSLRGLDAELALSWVDGPVEGLQSAVGAVVAHDVHGVQSSAGLAWAHGDVEMAQLSTFLNVAKGDVRGLQATAGANVAGGAVDGVQASAFVNVAVRGGRGVQATAGVNVAGDLQGVQAAPLNVARSVDGLQLGLVNVGRDVKGVQLGLVNVARTSEVSIAPINLIGDGLHRVDVWTSESAVANAALKFGSKNVYTLLGAGLVSAASPWWTWGGGFGLHLGRDPLWIEVDATAWGVSRGQVVAPGVHSKLRAQLGIDVAKHLAPFAGVSINSWYGDGSVWPEAIGLPSSTEVGRRVVTWPGFHAGISF